MGPNGTRDGGTQRDGSKSEECKVTTILSQDRDHTRMLRSIFVSLRYSAVPSWIPGYHLET